MPRTSRSGRKSIRADSVEGVPLFGKSFDLSVLFYRGTDDRRPVDEPDR